MSDVSLHLGDCLEVLRGLEAGSVDAVVTDPPYGLSFMGKHWDHGVPGVPYWLEVLRVMKPGAHLLAFGGTRTYHRLACAVEDAGFEIRDCIMWIYGSGFPKSLDVSKAIDKNNGEVGRLWKFTAYMRTTGLTAKKLNEATGTFMGSHYLTDKSQPAIPTPELWQVIRPLCGDVPAWVDDLVARIAAERDVVGQQERKGKPPQFMWGEDDGQSWNITAPATDAAKQWQGYGTALKPAHEPIIVARKPLVGTVAENVQEYGTGALNIDGCRIGLGEGEDVERLNARSGGKRGFASKYVGGTDHPLPSGADLSKGRWPANVIHDGSEEVLEGFAAFPIHGAGKARTSKEGTHSGNGNKVYGSGLGAPAMRFGDTGTAARFFYAAKASRKERGEGNGHPTVKPLALMEYLARLVTPPEGVILDPFMGSGTTGVAAVQLGRKFIGIELDSSYFAIAEKRISEAKQAMPLFQATAEVQT